MEVNHVVIGDPHGCLEELDELLKLVDHKSTHVKVILAGDLIDRGYDSVGCIRRARELKIPSVVGNHETRLIKWLRHGKSTNRPIPDYYHQLNDDDIKYVQSMPAFIKLDDAIVIHGGMKPNIPVEQQSIETLAYLRYTEKDTDRFVSLKKVLAHGKEAMNAQFWTEKGSFLTNVIYGHNVHSKTDVRIDRFDDGTACYSLDTGCVFGGRLSAIIWETKEIVQCQSKMEYFKGWY